MEYLILDEDQSSLTRGVLRNPPTANILEFEIPEADVPLVEGYVNLQFLGFDESSPSFAGKVTRRRGNRMAVERGASLGDTALDNLRVPFEHDSFIYPVSQDWQGRLSVRTHSLSCGAVGFYAKRGLQENEVVEVAIHVREGALLIQGKVVSQHQDTKGIFDTVVKFLSGVDDVERMVRREVLYLQLQQRDDLKDGKKRKELFRFS